MPLHYLLHKTYDINNLSIPETFFLQHHIFSVIFLLLAQNLRFLTNDDRKYFEPTLQTLHRYVGFGRHGLLAHHQTEGQIRSINALFSQQFV